MTAIRVGIVGFGTGARGFHAPLLQHSPCFVVTHVLERSTARSQSEVHPTPSLVRSMEALLAAPIDLVVVATPTAVHVEQCRQALEAGKHVVSDKPLCVHAADAEALIKLAEEQHVVFTVFQNRRWDSDFRTIQRLITQEDARLGTIEHYEAHFDRYRPTLKGYWKEKPVEGGGILFDLGAHLVDQALLLFGEPDACAFDVQIQREGAENDDYFRLELQYNQASKPKTVVLTAGMLVDAPEPRLRYLVRGSHGKVEKYGEDPQEQQLHSGKLPGDEGYGCEPESQWATLFDATGAVVERIPSEQGCYEVFYENLSDVIQGNATLLVDPHSVVAQIRILESAKTTTRVCRVKT